MRRLKAGLVIISNLARLAENKNIFGLPTISMEEATERGLFEWIAPDVRSMYIDAVVQEVRFPSISDDRRKALSIVYTPLHGAGNVPVREALRTAGYGDVHVVKEQELPDGDFPTVKSPNPGAPEALDLGIRTARDLQADIVMGTDPDSDRVGVAVRDGTGSYQHLTGNQVGALSTDFILSTRKVEGRLPKNGIVFKTIVTSDLGQAIADSYDVLTENTFTGFKYIGHGVTEYEQSGACQFLLGYEESYGYLISPIVRDKDAVQTCLTIAEMTSFYKGQNKTLLDALNSLFERFGYYRDELFTAPISGEDALNRLHDIMDGLPQNTPTVERLQLVAIEDYMTSQVTRVNDQGQPIGAAEPIHLPSSDVLKYVFDDKSWLAIRPSGTEPKLKAYLAARGKDEAECQAKTERMRAAIESRVD